jgi:ribosomal protein L37AE/L43A
MRLTEELSVMLDITEIGKTQRRPACGQCGGTGYVYLWSVARAGSRTWFCDRCKRTWSGAEPILATLAGDGVGVQGAPPVLVDSEQQAVRRQNVRRVQAARS